MVRPSKANKITAQTNAFADFSLLYTLSAHEMSCSQGECYSWQMHILMHSIIVLVYMPHCVPGRKRKTSRGERETDTQVRMSNRALCVSMRMRNAETANNANKQPKKKTYCLIYSVLSRCINVMVFASLEWASFFSRWFACHFARSLSLYRWIWLPHRIQQCNQMKLFIVGNWLAWIAQWTHFFTVAPTEVREIKNSGCRKKKMKEIKMWIKHVEKSPEH